MPWGQKALAGYLGDDQSTWAPYDATSLVTANPSKAEILIDQGQADQFLEEHLQPELFAAACEKSRQSVNIRMQEGYDHSYYFIATFMEDHLRHHAERL